MVKESLRDCAVAHQRRVERRIEDIDRHSGQTLEIRGDLEAFPAEIQSETEIERRYGGIIHFHRIIFVDDIVPVLVLVFQVTGTHFREGLHRAVVYFHLVMEYSRDLQSVALADGIARMVKVVIRLVCLVLVHDFGGKE